MNCKINWQLLISRETTLFERYLRVWGYSEMFGNESSVDVKNILVINHNGMTDLYIDPVDANKRKLVAYKEYKSKTTSLAILWNKVLCDLNKSLKSILKNRSFSYYDNFITNYRLARAIVFYTKALSLASNDLSKGDVNFIQKWHERAEVVSCTAWDKFSLFIKLISKENDIRFNDLLFYTPLDFKKLINNHEKINKKIIDKRKSYYLLLLKNKKISLYIGDKAKQLEKSLLNHLRSNNKSDAIEGSVAYAGKIKGRVRIVNTIYDMGKMQHGEILVSIMTTPRLVSAAIKASAIITDEGGIICHAAVISREFKIPCIVGTKNATKILKNGDYVEVNADKGTVKRLN